MNSLGSVCTPAYEWNIYDIVSNVLWRNSGLCWVLNRIWYWPAKRENSITLIRGKFHYFYTWALSLHFLVCKWFKLPKIRNWSSRSPKTQDLIIITTNPSLAKTRWTHLSEIQGLWRSQLPQRVTLQPLQSSHGNLLHRSQNFCQVLNHFHTHSNLQSEHLHTLSSRSAALIWTIIL